MSVKSRFVQACFGFITLLLVAGIATVFYFSWLPDPVLGKSDLLPDWLARWTDAPENDTLQTAVPFACSGLIIGSYLSVAFRDWRWWLSSWAGLTLIVFIAEAGQLILPHRNFDWADIAWGTTGSLAGLLLTGLGFAIVKVTVKTLCYTNKKLLRKNRL